MSKFLLLEEEEERCQAWGEGNVRAGARLPDHALLLPPSSVATDDERAPPARPAAAARICTVATDLPAARILVLI